MADRDASELGRCPECLVLEGRHAHDCVTGDKAFEAYEAARQHPTTPTPEPVESVGEVTRLEDDERDAYDAAKTWLHYRTRPTMATKTEACKLVVMLVERVAALRSEIADLRGKLERAERERNDAIIERNCAQMMAELDRAERDAATARATELERLLRTIVATCGAANHGMQCTCTICQAFGASIAAARKHLSTLPGSEETPDAQG